MDFQAPLVLSEKQCACGHGRVVSDVHTSECQIGETGSGHVLQRKYSWLLFDNWIHLRSLNSTIKWLPQSQPERVMLCLSIRIYCRS